LQLNRAVNKKAGLAAGFPHWRRGYFKPLTNPATALAWSSVIPAIGFW